ncbi:MAG: MgtC/SapB family protein [Cryomorphaceae bacterium]|nr:MgtC/SapB family protein [Flavobacteriales bacterium]
MEPELNIVLDLLVPLAIGLVIGAERGWSQREVPEGSRVAGLRTFGLAGLFGGISALVAQSLTVWFLPAAFLGLSMVVIVSHYLEFKTNKDLGVTSEMALLLTFVLGAWSVFDQKIAAVSAAVVVTALLGLKPILHKWLRYLKVEEIYAGIKFLIISVVLLPLLPNEGYGPYGALNPYWIWWMVVLISGLSLFGYIAMKSVGRRAGTFITGIVGAMASSTAVTLSLAKLAVKSTRKGVFTTAVLMACVVMFARVLIEVSVVNPALLSALWTPVAGMVAVMVVGGVWIYKSAEPPEADEKIEVGNPLQLGVALKFGLLLAAILLLSEFLSDRFGDQGIIVLAIVSGLADVDAVTLSLSEMAKDRVDEGLASFGIVLASVSNTLVKGGIFTFYVGVKTSLRFIVVILIASAAGVVLALTGAAFF